MRKPSARGEAINERRYRSWTDEFGSYRLQITNLTIEGWLNHFDAADKDLAARVLDAVDYYSQARIHAAFRQSLNALEGWHRSPSSRKGNWLFAAMSGSAGESGDAMLYQFRVANSLDAPSLNTMFLSRSDLFGRELTENDTVVLLDDFAGTGSQVCDAWNAPETSFGSLLASAGKVYLIVVAASKRARVRIKKETSLTLVSAHELKDSDDVFAESCKHFTPDERERLFYYGVIADRKQPKGYGECGLVVVFQHRTPSNTIPILHASHTKWLGLFPRND